MANLYIVRDIDQQTEKAHASLQEARYGALNVKRGEIVRIRLNPDLSKAALRCALYNRSPDLAAEREIIATIENGVARKLV